MQENKRHQINIEKDRESRSHNCEDEKERKRNIKKTERGRGG